MFACACMGLFLYGERNFFGSVVSHGVQFGKIGEDRERSKERRLTDERT